MILPVPYERPGNSARDHDAGLIQPAFERREVGLGDADIVAGGSVRGTEIRSHARIMSPIGAPFQMDRRSLLR
jgi:hypothetical protein